MTGDTQAAHALLNSRRAAGVPVQATPATDAAGLIAAGIAGAAMLYACAEGDDSAINVATAFEAAELRSKNGGLKVYAQVNDPVFALALRARRLGSPKAYPLHLDFFNVEELAARQLMRTEPVDTFGRVGRPHIVVAGAGVFAAAVVVEFARAWATRSGRLETRVAVTLLDPEAEVLAHDLAGRWEIVREICDLRPDQRELAEALRELSGSELAVDRAYLCHDDEEAAFRTALTAAGLWHGGPGSLVVRLHRMASHGAAFHAPGAEVLDDLGGRLRLVSMADLGCRPHLIHEDVVEWLARAIHDHYLIGQQRRGRRLGEGSIVEWERLTEELRQSNRDQALHIGAKLQLIAATLAPRTPASEPFEFTDTEVEMLARVEHDRWMAEKRRLGWVLGDTRDNAAKRHEALRPWGELTEALRDTNRDEIRSLPAVLSSVGLCIVRLGSAPVPQPRGEISIQASV